MNDQKLQRLALISEIVGGIAVIVTLVVLIFEVRENTETLKAATYDSLVADLAQHLLENTHDEQVFEAQFIRSTEGLDALTPRQLLRRQQVFVTQFMHYERAFIQWQAGNIDDEAWNRFHRAICRIAGPEFEESVGPRINGITTDSFRLYRANNCSN